MRWATAGLVLVAVVFGAAGSTAIATATPIETDTTSSSTTAGGQLEVTITIENTGPDSLAGLLLEFDQFPDGVSVVSVQGDGTYSRQSQAIVYFQAGSGDQLQTTLTIETDRCVRTPPSINATVTDTQDTVIGNITADLSVSPARIQPQQPLGPNQQRNCQVDPADPASFPRDCVVGSPPTSVFIGERLNVSKLPDSTSGDPIGPGVATFTGLGGAADGEVRSADAEQVELRLFSPGPYSTDDTGANATAELLVQEPAIQTVELYTQPDEAGVEVSNSQITEGFPAVYLRAQYNFDTADRLEVTVRDAEDTDVTAAVRPQGTRPFITSADQDTRLSFAEVGPGNYTIHTEGTALCPTATTELRVTEGGTTINAPENVTRGATATINVSGQPGAAAQIRVPADAVTGTESDVSIATQQSVAEQLFSPSGDVERRFYDDSQDQYVATIAAIDASGQSRIQLRTDQIRSSQLTLSVAAGTDPTTAADDTVQIAIHDPTITIATAPASVSARETFQVQGRAPASDQVAAYIQAGDTWYRVPGDDPIGAVNTSRYVLNLSATGPASFPSNYRVAVVADATVRGTTFPRTITETAWRDLSTSRSQLLRVRPPTLNVTVRNRQLAAATGDSSYLFGRTPTDRVRVYRIAPTGAVTTTAVDVQRGLFEYELRAGARGTHRFVVVSPGRDGAFAADDAHPTAASVQPRQAVARVVAAHTDSASDDNVELRQIAVEQPSLAATAQLNESHLTITGTTNRANGTVVFIDITDTEASTTQLLSETVENGQFSASIPLTELSAAPAVTQIEVTVGGLSRVISSTAITEAQPTTKTHSPGTRTAAVSSTTAEERPTPATRGTQAPTTPSVTDAGEPAPPDADKPTATAPAGSAPTSSAARVVVGLIVVALGVFAMVRQLD